MTSTIKVNTVKDTASTDIIKKCGTSITVGTASDTTTVAGNAVRSNALQASDGANIVSQVGTTITLGASGDTITLASGANQTGFGRTGTVDWQTGSIKTSTFTAANGEGYFANTSGGAFTMNLPAGVAGAIVSVADYAESFNSNNLTVVPNGSDKIGSVAQNATLNVKGQSVTFVFVDSTQGWINTMDSTSNVRGQLPFICASVSGTGNTLVTAPCCANAKVATFTGPGNFTVNSIGSAANNVVSYMIVAGGGGGGSNGGGGGAGGFREVKSPVTPYTASPLDGYSNSPNRITVAAQSYPITVGGGGNASTNYGSQNNTSGNNSQFDTIVSTGGGKGAGYIPGGGSNGGTGGSGGGAGCGSSLGAGNTPPTSPAQGFPGSTSGGPSGYGAGGGATQAGNVGVSPSSGGIGGNGATTSINGTPTARAGGGGGAGFGSASGYPGGPGGGGKGSGPEGTGIAGTINTGGGGGGAAGGGAGPTGAGGSGIVIIRYKFQ